MKAYIVSVALERAGRMPQGELGEKLKQQENLALYRYMNQDYALRGSVYRKTDSISSVERVRTA